MTSEHSLH